LLTGSNKNTVMSIWRLKRIGAAHKISYVLIFNILMSGCVSPTKGHLFIEDQFESPALSRLKISALENGVEIIKSNETAPKNVQKITIVFHNDQETRAKALLLFNTLIAEGHDVLISPEPYGNYHFTKNNIGVFWITNNKEEPLLRNRAFSSLLGTCGDDLIDHQLTIFGNNKFEFFSPCAEVCRKGSKEVIAGDWSSVESGYLLDVDGMFVEFSDTWNAKRQSIAWVLNQPAGFGIPKECQFYEQSVWAPN